MHQAGSPPPWRRRAGWVLPLQPEGGASRVGRSGKEGFRLALATFLSSSEKHLKERDFISFCSSGCDRLLSQQTGQGQSSRRFLLPPVIPSGTHWGRGEGDRPAPSPRAPLICIDARPRATGGAGRGGTGGGARARRHETGRVSKPRPALGRLRPPRARVRGAPCAPV